MRENIAQTMTSTITPILVRKNEDGDGGVEVENSRVRTWQGLSGQLLRDVV